MRSDTSPFTPGRPIPLEFFVGRIDEVERLHNLVKESTEGQFKIGFISGERGIGKSSLANFIRYYSEKENNVAGSHVFLGGVESINVAMQKTFEYFVRDSANTPWYQSVAEFFKEKIRTIDMFGVSIELAFDPDESTRLADTFIPTVGGLWRKLEKDKSGIVIIWDDINGLASSTDFANWLKSTVDTFAVSRQQIPLCILIVGLDERRDDLARHQPSLPRVFDDLVDIKPWTDDEAIKFYTRAFESVRVEIGSKELDTLVKFAGGFPVLAHEIGDAVWRMSQESLNGERRIEESKVIDGIILAAEIIGKTLLEPQVYNAIQSERYRSILRKMLDEPKMSFRRRDILGYLNADEVKVLDDFLRRMTDLGVIKRQTGVRGGYVFANLLHTLYFRMEAGYVARNRKLSKT